jgi:hypothetical protein
MHNPCRLTIRFRQSDDRALLEFETDDGASAEATMALPFGSDLPLVLEALDVAQFPNPVFQYHRFDAPAWARLAALGLWDGERLAPDIHARVGRALFQALVAHSDAAALVTQARSAARAASRPLELALRFNPSAVACADLPWELLWENDGSDMGLPLLLAQGSGSSCVRYLPQTLARPLPTPLASGSPIKLLAVSPLAGISDALRQRQRAALSSALESAVATGQVQLIAPDPPLTIAQLTKLVAEHQPDLISYYGHGMYQDGQGQLQLDADGGATAYVGADRLAFLAHSGVRVLLFQACQSAETAGGRLSSGIAGLLSALGVPAVIAMQSYLRVTAATRLQALVCGGLAAGQSVQEALAWARAALFAEEHDAVSWYVSTLTIASSKLQAIRLVEAPTASDAAGMTALARSGVRRRSLRMRDVAVGAAGVATVTALAVGGLAPLISGGAALTGSALATWLAGMGANTLAGWIGDWAAQAGDKLVRFAATGATEAEEELLDAMARDLEQRMGQDRALADAVAALLEQTGAVETALDALSQQVDAQTDLLCDLNERISDQRQLLELLRADLRHSDLIQGRLHKLLLQELAAQTATLLQAYVAGTAQLSQEIAAVLAAVRALHDEMQAALAAQPSATAQGATGGHTVEMHGGNYFGGAQIGSVGKYRCGRLLRR